MSRSETPLTTEESGSSSGGLLPHLKMLAGEVERAIVTNYPPDTFLGRKTQEPFPKEEAE